MIKALFWLHLAPFTQYKTPGFKKDAESTNCCLAQQKACWPLRQPMWWQTGAAALAAGCIR